MFKKFVLIALATAASSVFGAPTAPQGVTDTDVLQFALTLEHLENAFYSGALKKFGESQFEADGFPAFVRGRFSQIAEHEAAHVKFLTAALGENATKPCEYDFMYNSPRSFVALSMALETVGGSAYLGAAQFISDKSTLTAAASILAVESRHASWVSSAVMKQQPWNGPLDTPLFPSGAFSLAAQFIKNCPSTNPVLPVKPFPALTLSNTSPASGSQVSANFAGLQSQQGKAFVAWLDGLDVVYSDLGPDGKTTVPAGLEGTTYAAVVSSKDQPPSDATLVTGFAIIQFPFDSRGKSE